MLYDFLIENRQELIERCRAKVALRAAPKATPIELEHGIPLFLDQLVRTLQAEQRASATQVRAVSGPRGGRQPDHSEIGLTASRHGRELLEQGCTIDQVVHDYGDLCQAVTELAFEDRTSIEVDEFRTLNRCLDNAIADAVKEFAAQRDVLVASNDIDPGQERHLALAHAMKELIQRASLAVVAIKAGKVGFSGATGSVLEISLAEMRDLADKSLKGAVPEAPTR